jgi:Flp pilus assembly protein TadG
MKSRTDQAATRQARSREAGQSLVETALFVPIMLIAVLVTADLGRACYAAIEVADAARAGVQYGAQSVVTAADTSGMQTAAKNDAADLSALNVSATSFCACVDGSQVNCITGTCSSGTPGTYVQVTTSTTFTPLIDYPGLPSSIPLGDTAVMRVQ